MLHFAYDRKYPVQVWFSSCDLNITCVYRHAQNKPAWRDKIRATHTWHVLECATITDMYHKMPHKPAWQDKICATHT